MKIFGTEITGEHAFAAATGAGLLVAAARYTGIGREKIVDFLYDDDDFTVSVIDKTDGDKELDPQGNIVSA